jgi:DNA-binding NtrC family response regulator
MSATPRATNSDTRPVVIIVDDYEDALAMLKKRVELDTDFRVLTATTGRQLFELIFQHRKVAAVLLDINLPGDLGTDIAKEIRRQRPGLPVALVTAYVPTRAMQDDAEAAGAPIWDKVEIAGAHELVTRLQELTRTAS